MLRPVRPLACFTAICYHAAPPTLLKPTACTTVLASKALRKGGVQLLLHPLHDCLPLLCSSNVACFSMANWPRQVCNPWFRKMKVECSVVDQSSCRVLAEARKGSLRSNSAVCSEIQRRTKVSASCEGGDPTSRSGSLCQNSCLTR